MTGSCTRRTTTVRRDKLGLALGGSGRWQAVLDSDPNVKGNGTTKEKAIQAFLTTAGYLGLPNEKTSYEFHDSGEV